MATESHDTSRWKNKAEFLMATVGASIGLGNLWRFPYQCYANGGGAFLIPYLIMATTVGFPLVLADLALSQYSGKGSLACWDAAPLMSGIGWCFSLRTVIASSHYTIIVSFGALYMFASLRSSLPWATCDNEWNTPHCRSFEDILRQEECKNVNLTSKPLFCGMNASAMEFVNQTYNASIQQIPISVNSTLLTPKTPSEEYFHNHIYQLTSGIEEIGTIRWPLCLSFLFTLGVAFLYLMFGVRSWGKMSYLTTLLPYVVLTAFLIQSLRRNGAKDGILYILWPKWHRVASHSVWADAAIQVGYSLGGGGGFLLTVGCRNKFKNNFINDAIFLTVCDSLTSIFCGIVIFSIIGSMTYDFGVSIDKVIGQGAGLTFIVYADMLTRMSIAPLWSVIFNFMLFNLGIGAVVGGLNQVQTNILAISPPRFHRRPWPIVLLLALLVLWFIAGLACITQGGMYVIQMMDGYVSITILFTGLIKTITIAWIYGTDRLSNDVYVMTGWRMHRIYWYIYKFFTPAVFCVCLGLRFTEIRPLRYGSYIFPAWSKNVSWFVVALITIMFPIVAIFKLFFTNKGLSIKERLVVLTTPTPDWGQREHEDKIQTEHQEPELEELKPL